MASSLRVSRVKGRPRRVEHAWGTGSARVMTDARPMAKLLLNC